MVRQRVRGTASADVDDDRKRRRPGSSATGCILVHIGLDQLLKTVVYFSEPRGRLLLIK